MKAFNLNLLPSPPCALLLEGLYFDTASRKIEATIETCGLMLTGPVLTTSDCIFAVSSNNWWTECFIFRLKCFITGKQTSLSRWNTLAFISHSELFPSTQSESAGLNVGGHFVLVTSALSGEHREPWALLKVRKGRKISDPEWEQDVFLGVCVCKVCVSVHSGRRPISNQTNRKYRHPGEEADQHVARQRE